MIKEQDHKPERIAKVIARAGLCSRREAERWIEAGRVQLNGQRLTTPAQTVTASDKIVVDGKRLPKAEETRLFMYHKPAGLVTTASDELGRTTVFDRLSPELPRLISVGRLDLNTEGLLMLTNDGELSRHMELPSTGWVRRYRVRVLGTVDTKRLDKLKDGITVDGIHYGSIIAKIDKNEHSTDQRTANAWLQVSLTEGKNREIRKVMEAIDLKVNRLIRLSYGPFQLGNLPKEGVKEVPRKILKDQLPEFF